MSENPETIKRLADLIDDLTGLIETAVDEDGVGMSIVDIADASKAVACLAQAQGNLAKSERFSGGKK